MPPTITFKRGTTSECDAVTPSSGEPMYDEDIEQLRMGDGSTAGGKNVAMEDVGVARTFMVNAFQYPNPGTDWTPAIEGATLGAGLSAKKVWLPLNFLKIGDIITSVTLVGDIHEEGGDTITLDAKLVRVNKADPITATDITNGTMTQQDADGDFDVATNNDDETVATDKQYLLEIEGTTSNVSANEKIIVIGAEVAVTRLP